jgi:hypothetical protein
MVWAAGKLRQANGNNDFAAKLLILRMQMSGHCT